MEAESRGVLPPLNDLALNRISGFFYAVGDPGREFAFGANVEIFARTTLTLHPEGFE